MSSISSSVINLVPMVPRLRFEIPVGGTSTISIPANKLMDLKGPLQPVGAPLAMICGNPGCDSEYFRVIGKNKHCSLCLTPVLLE